MSANQQYQFDYWTDKMNSYEFFRKWDDYEYAKYRVEESKNPDSIWLK